MLKISKKVLVIYRKFNKYHFSIVEIQRLTKRLN